MTVSISNQPIKYYDISQKTFGKDNSHIHTITVGDTKYGMFVKDTKPVQNVKPGDVVSFNAAKNQRGYWNADPQSFKVVRRSNVETQQRVPAGGEDARQASILRQSSMNYASTIVAALIQAGRMEGVNADECAQEVIRIADEYFYPFASSGDKNYGVKDPVSDYQQEDDEAAF